MDFNISEFMTKVSYILKLLTYYIQQLINKIGPMLPDQYKDPLSD